MGKRAGSRFHPLYRGTWFPTAHIVKDLGVEQKFPSAISRYLVSNGARKSLWLVWAICFHPLYRGTWFPTLGRNRCKIRRKKVSIRYIAVLGFQLTLLRKCMRRTLTFPSAISRYLVSNPTSKTPPLTSGGGNGLHTPRRIDHIPTFASLNSDKNTRSTHYTPNAGIELSETTPPPLRVNPVQNWI